jgi:hypothetical protein
MLGFLFPAADDVGIILKLYAYAVWTPFADDASCLRAPIWCSTVVKFSRLLRDWTVLSSRWETVALGSVDIVPFIDLFVLFFFFLQAAVLISPLASCRVTILQGFLIFRGGRMRRVVGSPTFKHNELLLTFLLLLRWNTSNFIEIISTLSQRLKSILCCGNSQLLVMIFPGCYSEL